MYFPYSADVTPDVEQRFATIRFPARQGIAGWVLREAVAQLVPDVTQDPRWYRHVDEASGMVSKSLRVHRCAPDAA